MKLAVISLFPEIFTSSLNSGLVGQAFAREQVSLQVVNPRDFAQNRYGSIDDSPFGGGDGMVLQAEPLSQAVEGVLHQWQTERQKVLIVHPSPRGVPLTDALVRQWARKENLVFVCSRYGGVDERFLRESVDVEVCVGDFVVTGGEFPALMMIDALVRMQPGVLGNEQSSEVESFADGLLEYPQYTRPREWRQWSVPEVLLSGNHRKVDQWRRWLSILKTACVRSDLLGRAHVPPTDLLAAWHYYDSLSEKQRQELGLRGNLKKEEVVIYER